LQPDMACCGVLPVMQLPPEIPAGERFIRCLIIQARTHHEYCLFKRKALRLCMTLNPRLP